VSAVLLLDSTALVAYERDLTRRVQALVMEAMVDGRLMATPAVSLAAAAGELAGDARELAWLVYDRDGPLSVLPLALNALEVGTLAAGADTADKAALALEVAHTVYEARAASAVVLTLDPGRYSGHHVNVLDLRP
jgi:hypothetical protein